MSCIHSQYLKAEGELEVYECRRPGIRFDEVVLCDIDNCTDVEEDEEYTPMRF